MVTCSKTFPSLAEVVLTTPFTLLPVAVSALAGASNSTRGLHAGGRTGTPAAEALQNVIGFITIESTGNASDFGDLTVGRDRLGQGAADAHGGIGD